MRFLPAAVLVAMCGVPPPKHQQNEKTVGDTYTTDQAQSLLKFALFRLFEEKFTKDWRAWHPQAGG
jgi:4-alpha-glucanotransferase